MLKTRMQHAQNRGNPSQRSRILHSPEGGFCQTTPHMEMERSQCKQVASDSAKAIGFEKVNVQDYDNYHYSIIYGMDKEGYSFQYACESKKGFGYLIINGPRSDKRSELRDKLGNEIKKRAKTVKK